MKMLFFIVLIIFTVKCSFQASVSNNPIINCEALVSESKIKSCGLCKTGYILSENRLECLACPSFCKNGYCQLKSTASGGNDPTECKKCIDHYFLDSNKCQECSSGCKNCTSNSNCLECYSNHILQETTKKCLSCPNNCLKCNLANSNSETVCETCSPRYTKKENGCTTCRSYCQSCTYDKNTGVSCSGCDDNAYLEKNGNIGKCELCSKVSSGCQKCTDKDTCKKCISDSYTLTKDNKCEPCSNINSACTKCDGSSGTNKCTECATGYYIKSESCSSCPRNCATCDEKESTIVCTKCKPYYTITSIKSCDRCPDNCDMCQLSNDKLVCVTCSDKYAKNANNLCSKCPDNCHACTWNVGNSRTECSGTQTSHSCVENENGKSWTLKSDGTCASCPGNCEKCYFETTSAPNPICYASKCTKGYTFDDNTGSCIACPAGCDYCKKRLASTVCLKCSEKFAPKYNTNDAIDSCLACSVQNCDYCEVIDDTVQCLRSQCASKTSGTNKKFSFQSDTCSSNCPDSECSPGYVNDESGSCYCRSCPTGKKIIDAGPNAGVCMGCGENCLDCQLTTDKTDVVCKTCVGTKQWLTVHESGSTKKGCYDCTKAAPLCKVFEISGTPKTCKCKLGECMGDVSVSSPTSFHTVLQETGTTYQKCKRCSEVFPNALWCSGNLGPNLASTSASVAKCKYGYIKKGISDVCLSIPVGCSLITNADSGSGTASCSKCAVGYYGSDCTPCPTDCKSCVKSGVNPLFCTECKSATKTGQTCTLDVATACPMTVSNCDAPFADSPSSCTKCSKCSAGFAILSREANTFNNIGSPCVPITPSLTPIPNCDQYYNDPMSPTGDLKCARCLTNYVPTNYVHCGTFANCKENYQYDDMTVKCKVAATGYVANEDGTSILEVLNPQRTNSECTGYTYFGSAFSAVNARCGGCTPNHELDSSSASKYDCVSCRVQDIPDCLQVAASNGVCVCRECAAPSGGFQYIKHPTEIGCVKVSDITNCNAYTLRLVNGQYQGVCTACSSGIPLKDGSSCISCTKTCSNGDKVSNDAGSDCICNCNSNTVLSSSGEDCVSCSGPNCATYELGSGGSCVCKTCNSGFVLKDDKTGCISCSNSGNAGISNCVKCSLKASNQDEVERCTECNSGFGLRSDGSMCEQCLPNPGCRKCTVDSSGSSPTTQNKCTECSSGWQLNSAKTCVQCPQSPQPCGECRIDPNDDAKTLCLSFGCQTTSNALRDEDLKCEACSISNCEYCVKDLQNSFTCLTCLNGYFKSDDGVCTACGDGCNFCQEASKCLPHGCKEGFIRHRLDGSCIKCSGEGVARCSYESSTTENLIVENCVIGYRLNSGITPKLCEKCDLNCKGCTTNGKGKCDSNECNSGYFYESSDQRCYEALSGCSVSTRVNDKTICSSCASANKYIVNGGCSDCPAGCAGCSFDTSNNKVICSSCSGGYYKDGDTCTKCADGCSTCSGANECSSCNTAYGLKGGKCEPCGIAQCTECEVQSGQTDLTCKTCAQKFLLNGDNCGLCPKFCQVCSFEKKYQCQLCNDKYARATDGECIPCPSNCEKCVTLDKSVRCTKCISNNFSLQTDGTCMSCDEAAFPNCATCETSLPGVKAKCLNCKEGYILQDDGEQCLSHSIEGCETYAHGLICSKCKDGYHLNNFNRECTRKCYECSGNENDCGRDISKTSNSTENIKLIHCPTGVCWAFRTEEQSTVTFRRGCSNETCTNSILNENCYKANNKLECRKCCREESCNTWFLDGKAGVAQNIQNILIILLANVITTSLTIMVDFV